MASFQCDCRRMYLRKNTMYRIGSATRHTRAQNMHAGTLEGGTLAWAVTKLGRANAISL